MHRWCLGVTLASMLLILSGQIQIGARPVAGNNTSTQYGASVTTAASISAVNAVPFTQTCSCGVDCGSGQCTFHCEGSIGACGACIISCCAAEGKRACGELLN